MCLMIKYKKKKVCVFEHCCWSADYDSKMNNSCNKDGNISDAADFVIYGDGTSVACDIIV